jgi:flagellar basal-body rod protein FlgC
MNKLLIVVIFLSSHFANAKTCEDVEHLTLAMNIISSNIANVNTTRTPDGGPYQRKQLVCENGSCDVVEYSDVVVKYFPDHPDADQFGYVSFPDIDLQYEISSLIEVSREHELAILRCH